MFAKKFFSFSSKPFSYISHSFSNFFGIFTVSTTDPSEPDYSDSKPQQTEFNFYQIKSQTQKELVSNYERWVGKMNISHNMTEKKPCQVSLTKKSIFGNILGSLAQQKNCLENRCVSIQLAANNPIQDRITTDQITDIQGYLLNIFDGHGGWQLAEYCMEMFPRKFQKNISDSFEFSQELGISQDQIVIESIERTYDSIENGFLKIARKAKEMGLLKTGSVGTGALSVFVHDNKLFVANNGESKGFLCSESEEGVIKYRKINKKLEKKILGEKPSQKVMFEINESQKKIARKHDKNKILSLENIFQSSRAFGDFSHKYPEFYEETGGDYNGPRITHRPEIKVFDLSRKDRFLILGSDGVWEFVKKHDLEKIVQGGAENIYAIAENIFRFAMSKICERNGIEKEELIELGLGPERRKFHDDMSLMVVDLKNQSK